MPYGSSAWGTSPFGSIVPLAISSSRATSTNTVLVVLTALPLAESSITDGDALNPNTWECYSSTTTFTILSVRKVSDVEYELRTLQKFGAMQQAHTVRSYTMRNPYGTYITAPYTATFRGVVMAAGSRPDRLPFDLHNDPIGADGYGGTLRVGPTGTYDRVYGTEMLKKQIIRRLVTMPASYFHIDAGSFGTDMKLKQKVSPNFLPELQTNITRDILREPNIKNAKVSLVLKKDGILIINVAAVSDFGTTDVSITAGS